MHKRDSRRQGLISETDQNFIQNLKKKTERSEAILQYIRDRKRKELSLYKFEIMFIVNLYLKILMCAVKIISGLSFSLLHGFFPVDHQRTCLIMILGTVLCKAIEFLILIFPPKFLMLNLICLFFNWIGFVFWDLLLLQLIYGVREEYHIWVVIMSCLQIIFFDFIGNKWILLIKGLFWTFSISLLFYFLIQNLQEINLLYFFLYFIYFQVKLIFKIKKLQNEQVPKSLQQYKTFITFLIESERIKFRSCNR